MGKFVGKLEGFYGSLNPAGQAMLGTILEGAQSGDTSAYVFRSRRCGDPAEGSSGSESQAEG